MCQKYISLMYENQIFKMVIWFKGIETGPKDYTSEKELVIW